MIFQHAFTLLFLVLNFIQVLKGQEDTTIDTCAGVTCNNRGNCVPNLAYSRGYWCECDEGWAGQDCNHPEPTVQCGDDRIDVVIDKGLVRELEIDDAVQYVYFGKSSASSQCRATEEDNLYKLSIKAPFSNCGTQVIQREPGDDYTFSNTVVWNREVHNTNNLIDRELILLDFKCIYEDTYTVSGPAILPTLNVLKFVTEQGRFEVEMRLFSDNSYSPAFEYTQSPTIGIGQYVYVQVELSYSSVSTLVVTMDRCFASQSRDPADPISTKHMLISDRCANPNDTTVQIRYNGEQQNGQFKFQMFKWRYSADDVYLHCEVDICNRTGEVCTGEGIDCKGLGGFRKKREALTHEGVYDQDFMPHSGHFITNGPIKVKVDDLDLISDSLKNEETVDTTMIVLVIIFGLIMIILGIVGGVIFRRKQKQRKQNARKELEDTTQRQFTSLNFTTESF